MREIILNYLKDIFPSDVFSIAEEVYNLGDIASGVASELEDYWEGRLVREFQDGYSAGESEGYDQGYEDAGAAKE